MDGSEPAERKRGELLMADYLTTDTELTSIANAIRTKGGTSAALTYPAGFVSAIEAIPTGGVVVQESDVNFIDYDGTIVASKTKAQINAMTADTDLPENPTHAGLTSQGWNWTVAQLKAQLLAMPDQPVWVGQMYATVSGATEIDVEMQKGRLSPIMVLSPKGTVSIDWGDNTTPDTLTGNSLYTQKDVSHTYASPGKYTIKISRTSGTYNIYCSATKTILRKNTTANENQVYSNAIKHVRVGSYCTVYNNAFYQCTSLETVTLPSDLPALGANPFQNCYSLKSLTLPKSQTFLETGLCTKCTSMRYMSICGGMTTSYGSIFSSCQALRSITIPCGLSKTGSYMFQYCYSIDKIYLPEGLTEIGNSSFQYCQSLANFTVPSTVTSILSAAFSHCEGLNEIHMLPTSPPTLEASNIFNNEATDFVIYVPRGKLNDYQTASVWSNYASKMQEEPA